MKIKTALPLLCIPLLSFCISSHAADTTSPGATPVAKSPVVITQPGQTVTALPANATMINQVVAIVNNQAITSHQLDQAVQFATLQAQQLGLAMPDPLSFRRQVLQQVIDQAIALQLAKINHLTITTQALNSALQELATHNHMTLKQLQTTITNNGMSFETYAHMIQNRLLITKLEQHAVANSVMVTQSEVNNYLIQQTKQLSPNTLYDIEHILITPTGTPTASNLAKAKVQAQQVAQDIKKGLPFSEAAIKYSQAGDALKGGDLGWQTLNQLPTIFVKPLQNMRDGEVYGPFQTDSGFHIIKLVGKKTPAQAQHFVTKYNLSQILVKETPIKSTLQAKAEIIQLRNEIVNGGKSFASIAKTNSEDDNTNKQGGALGWVSLTQLPPKVAAQAPNLIFNTVSHPIESAGGNWYLIKVTGKKQVNDTKEFQEEQARMAIFQKKAAQALKTWQAQIRGASYVKIVDPTLAPAN